VGYLDDLKRQAEEAKARQTVDTAALDRNAMLTDAACQSAFRYFNSLAQQLNVLQPVSRAVFRFDTRNEFRDLRLSGLRADSRQKRLRGADVYDHVLLGFDLKTGKRITVAKDFPPEIERLERRLNQCGAAFHSEILKDAETGRFLEKRFEFVADFHGVVRVLPDHDSGWIRFELVNLEGFETVIVRFN
jgi:hypothetical protein